MAHYTVHTRRISDPVVWSASFHFVAAALAWCVPAYGLVATLSSCLSVAWHIQREPRGLLMTLDYVAAAAWTAVELYLSDSLRERLIVAALNGAVLWGQRISNRCSDYDRGHSLWHVCSSVKSAFVAAAIARCIVV